MKKTFDLEKRTFTFALNVRYFVRKIKNTLEAVNDKNQVLRSSGSIGANYIEANESVSTKDFVYRLKVCKKETKESIYWLELMKGITNPVLEDERKKLINEAEELLRIFISIIDKVES